ncbi:MAG: glycosyltransferase [Oscillospiraceae bacterium]|nr:glycosyltransferase [Oscillospiraceae bacterium]
MSGPVCFSVLVPVYNTERWLGACIDSVLGQSYPHFELLLVDDGSTDASGAICDEYAARDGRIRVFHKENGGLISARRYAVARQKGDYCVFLDADDSLAPHALETLRAAIDGSGADCVIYGIRWDKPGGTEHLTTPPAMCHRLITDKREVLNHVLLTEAYNSLCRKCVKSSCFDGRDFSPYFSIKGGEDLLQSTEVYENAESFYFLPDELYLYRFNEASITHTVCYDDYPADYTVSSCICASLEKLGVFSEADYDRLRNHLLNVQVLELKRICRFCTSREQMIAAMQRIRGAAFYRDFLSVGYRGGRTDLRRILNSVVLFLLEHGRYDALIFFCTRVYRAG